MESIYYVCTWLCHRTCPHCYEDRFRPYYGSDLDRIAKQSRANFAEIIDHFPPTMTYRDPAEGFAEKTGSVILAGGEVLLEAVRESVLYPALDRLWAKYAGRVKLIVQTTGDLLTPQLVSELVDRHVWLISVSGIDAFHAGLEERRAQEALTERLTGMLTAGGLEHLPLVAADSRKASDDGRYFHFFGATPDMWIGRLWPRGRAWSNGLTSATLADNFCNRWSGGLGFLDYEHAGSEVSIDPEGNVYPCCVKTKKPVGNVMEEPLLTILDRLRGNPVYEAISMGHPERMGIAHGWSVEKFYEKSRTTLPDGREYANLCAGCDAFHDEVLANGLVRIG
ncbi:MAG: SPASM domain-containing protein [Bryobacteraceae bacterium]|nr:SPASM domain-containing protein [Bryobacteraceae bacterium]